MSHFVGVGSAVLPRAEGRIRAVGLLALLITVSACADSNGALEPTAGDLTLVSATSVDEIPGQYIITFRNDVSDVPGLAKKLAAENGGQVGFTYTNAIKGFSAQLPEQAIAALQRNPQIERIEQDEVAHLAGTQTGAIWNLDRIDQRTRPVDGSYTYPTDGSGVHVYILDTGIRTTHVEFGGRAVGAYTAINDGRGTNDCGGHGTLHNNRILQDNALSVLVRTIVRPPGREKTPGM